MSSGIKFPPQPFLSDFPEPPSLSLVTVYLYTYTSIHLKTRSSELHLLESCVNHSRLTSQTPQTDKYRQNVRTPRLAYSCISPPNLSDMCVLADHIDRQAPVALYVRFRPHFRRCIQAAERGFAM